ncbi:MAG: HesB/IscA family protein [Leptolyngbyaceae cyanobacterium]
MIQLSPAALQEVCRLKARCNRSNSMFRLGVQAGNCLDLSYQMTFDAMVMPADRVFEYDGLQIVINASSLSYLQGLMLDYTEDLMGGGFRFCNPNAIEACGCGYSFSVT